MMLLRSLIEPEKRTNLHDSERSSKNTNKAATIAAATYDVVTAALALAIENCF